MSDRERLLDREAVAREQHQWVRLTRCCNNRCRFCLDTEAFDGSHVPRAEIEAQIVGGVRQGATRLILSGGEPTIHPDFVDFVRLGKQSGYRKVQAITNGRMFSYPKFLQRALGAGLSEITFSVHGPDEHIHDHLVGVSGAFAQEVAAIRAALADGRPVVNIDVCLNRANIEHLPRLLDRFMALGVREFDLLHLIPFGRAFEDGSSDLAYDIDAALPSIQYALELARRPDVHIWFNRFPPPYLEGHEHLIQDPTKLEDEVRGRRRELDRWVRAGEPLPCRSPERCAHCYLRPMCDLLDETRGRLADRDFQLLRVSSADRHVPGWPVCTGWLRAADVAAAERLGGDLAADEVILELERYDDLAAHVHDGRFAGKRLTRLYVARPVDLDPVLALEGIEVVALLNRAMVTHLEGKPQLLARVAVAARNCASAAEAADAVDLSAFFRDTAHSGPVENVPACISGRVPRSELATLDASILADDGVLDVDAFARWYIHEHYTTKSRRCRQCVHEATCAGAHINLIRAAGYQILRPRVKKDSVPA